MFSGLENFVFRFRIRFDRDGFLFVSRMNIFFCLRLDILLHFGFLFYIFAIRKRLSKISSYTKL